VNAPENPRDPPRDSGFYSPAVERALDIVEVLARAPGGLTLSELSARLGLPKNAVFRITNTLRERGYLARDEKSLRFALTERLLRLSQPRAGGRSLVELSIDVMRDLRDECRETVQVGRLLGDEGVILEQVEALSPVRISVDAGTRFALYNNAPGKLLLAYLPDRERNARLERLRLVACTPRTITDKGELLRECRRIRERGYSTDYAEADEGIHCVAAPLFDGRGDVVATIWVSAFSRRMPKASFPDVARRVTRAAARVSERLR
jgi:DNA-binding IclR family transcriptional regulator